MDLTNSTVILAPRQHDLVRFLVQPAHWPTYSVLQRDARPTVLPSAPTCPQWARIPAVPIGRLDSYILGQALHTAAAVLQRLLLGLSTKLYPEHATLVLFDKSKSYCK